MPEMTNIFRKNQFLRPQRLQILFLGHDIFRDAGLYRRAWILFLILLIFVIYIPDTTYFICHLDNLNLLTELVGPYITTSLSIWKVIFILIKNHELNGIIRELREMWPDSMKQN